MSDQPPIQFQVPARVDSSSAAAFETAVMQEIGSGSGRLILDFSQTGYISSAGLRVVLLSAKKTKQGGGRMVMCGLSAPVMDVFRVSGFAKILDIVETLDQALAKVG